MRLILVTFLLLFSFYNVLAETLQPRIIAPYKVEVYDREIEYIYKNILNNPQDDLVQRIYKVTQYFLGRPYVLGAMGEGVTGEFDQMPLYRTDIFDCTTFVEVTLALSEANNLEQFKKYINLIRYKNGDVNYINRNHFAHFDWDRNNAKSGFIKDITDKIDPNYKQVITIIDKPSWYRDKTLADLQIIGPMTNQQAQSLLTQFRALAKYVTISKDSIRYVPLSHLFYAENGFITPQKNIFKKIPNGAIIEIVNTQNNLKEKIGTNLNVRHMGWVFHINDEIIFREASTIHKKVVDVPLAEYLSSYYNPANLETMGINIQMPLQKNK